MSPAGLDSLFELVLDSNDSGNPSIESITANVSVRPSNGALKCPTSCGFGTARMDVSFLDWRHQVAPKPWVIRSVGIGVCTPRKYGLMTKTGFPQNSTSESKGQKRNRTRIFWRVNPRALSERK